MSDPSRCRGLNFIYSVAFHLVIIDGAEAGSEATLPYAVRRAPTRATSVVLLLRQGEADASHAFGHVLARLIADHLAPTIPTIALTNGVPPAPLVHRRMYRWSLPPDTFPRRTSRCC